MDADIQFGDVAEEQPRTMLRPDENPQFAVVACGDVQATDLPIYADLDCLLDMEDHALSNPEVELGGVMLGGQFVDAEGKSFVVVNDSLRAEHYESTRGSFKFTHDTWSHITRRLEAYPAEMRMVGWYHTHPDWGVFLSGMDLFICENFFNKPLDLALVIDPCRQDRGWFQWRPERGKNPQRTGGFYLYSSRFRQQELAYFAQILEGSTTMPATMRSNTSTSGGYGAPVVNVVSERSPWTMLAVLGMLVMQSALLVLLFWQMNQGTSHEALTRWLEKEKQQTELNARRETLDHVAQQIANTKEGFVQELEKSSNQAKNFQTQLEVLTRAEQVSKETIKAQTEMVDVLTRERDHLQEKLKAFEVKLAKLEKIGRDEKAAADKNYAAEKNSDKTAGISQSLWIGIGIATAVFLCGVGAVWYQKEQAKREESPIDFPLSDASATNEEPSLKIHSQDTNTNQGNAE
jgi:proteasome lid subunit RPN8/RPN11